MGVAYQHKHVYEDSGLGLVFLDLLPICGLSLLCGVILPNSQTAGAAVGATLRISGESLCLFILILDISVCNICNGNLNRFTKKKDVFGHVNIVYV